MKHVHVFEHDNVVCNNMSCYVICIVGIQSIIPVTIIIMYLYMYMCVCTHHCVCAQCVVSCPHLFLTTRIITSFCECTRMLIVSDVRILTLD